MPAPVMTVTVIAPAPHTDPVVPAGEKKVVDAVITYDTGTYVTGGVAIAASDFGLSRLDGILVIGGSVHTGEYDHVAGKMRLRVAATGAEVGNVALTASSSIRVRAIGV